MTQSTQPDNKCNICPRRCNIDRTHNKGYCLMNDKIMAARAALHMWEEPCISGERGSGAIFFSGCTLRCVFCQNHDIASAKVGKELSVDELSDVMLRLQDNKADNINLVTPTHFTIPIIKAIEKARNKGLRIPVVYNTSAYENVETLRMLDGIVDVYLPDFKYMSPVLSKKYSHAPDYAEVAKAAIAEMVRQTGKAVFVNGDEDNLILSGTIVRHLTLPGCMADSMQILKYLHDTYGDMIYISIMNQFTPLSNLEKYPELNRRITDEEYETLVDYAIETGIENGFIQEGNTAEESFIPAFDCEGV